MPFRINYQLFMLCTWVLMFTFPGFAKMGFLPGALALMPELISAVMVVLIFTYLAKGGRIVIKSKFIVLFALFYISVAIGVVVNDVHSGAVISGLRYYLRFLPFFIIPFIYRFSEKELGTQLKLLAALSAMQLPVSLYQRFILGGDSLTGDIVKGTFVTGGHEAIFLFGAVAFLIVFYLRKLIGVKLVGFLFLLFLLPNVLNETKSSVIFLLVVIVAPIFVTKVSQSTMKKYVPILILSGAFLAVFYVAYQALFLKESRRFDSTADAFAYERLEDYLIRADDEKERYGRFAKILITVQVISKDPITLFFGLGLGNTTDSAFGIHFEGPLFETYELIKAATLSFVLFDVGLIGLTICIFLYVYIWKETKKLSFGEDLYAAVAHAWLVVMVMLLFAVTYRSLVLSYILGFVVTYMSGLMVAESCRRQFDKGR